MHTYIALFRGINVGGNNILPMKELKNVLESKGMQNVQTYIQSGNVAFQHKSRDVAALSESVSAAIEKSHGFKPKVLIFSREILDDAINQNPFPEAVSEPKTLHIWFLSSETENPDIEKIDFLKSETERYELIGDLFYLNAPDGIGRSKLAEKVERCLGVPATARNWRTVSKISEMVEQHF